MSNYKESDSWKLRPKNLRFKTFESLRSLYEPSEPLESKNEPDLEACVDSGEHFGKPKGITTKKD